MMNVVRSMPMYFLPYMLFSFQTPYFLTISFFSSLTSGKVSSYFSANFLCEAAPSGLTPTTTAPFFSIAFRLSWNAQASLVQPEVLSFG